MNMKMRDEITEFCSPGCDRYDFLIRWLTREEITHSVIPTGQARHIMIRLDKERPYLKRFYIKTLVAHYDRVQGTPGANDNSASVFELLYSIKKLKTLKQAHNIQIILTDKEELDDRDSVVSQGAYQLAHLFREKNIRNCIFFVFDMCGIGDTLISGRAGLQLLKSKYDNEVRFRKLYNDMINFNSSLADLFLSFRDGEFFHLNSLFSDDLGFLLNRYPALQISVLPYEEAIAMKRDLFRIKPEEWKKLTDKGILSAEYRFFLKNILPASWKNNHGSDDTVEHLTESAFTVIDEFILELAHYQIPYGENNS
ncbi:MAG: M28 family peptidase [Spirochaetaceae bacterium]|nr:M28 family peptidase [Spirochaetaceae bacterium]